jgi:Amt family ammonium transporter
MKRALKYDDTLDAFGVGGKRIADFVATLLFFFQPCLLSGFVGNVLTGIFAAKWVAALDGDVIPGGAIDGNGYAVGYAFASATSIAAWSFVVTFIILCIINRLPGMRFRCSPVRLICSYGVL